MAEAALCLSVGPAEGDVIGVFIGTGKDRPRWLVAIRFYTFDSLTSRRGGETGRRRRKRKGEEKGGGGGGKRRRRRKKRRGNKKKKRGAEEEEEGGKTGRCKRSNSLIHGLF